ncbi:hypothetical protein QE152_g27278 [Popillia japonica]|uniref:Uncharacterized protein n=1 Tax=Popillia japonica TaxID=7064 RepID=A0AAW1JWU2_POPJA
MLAGKVYHHHGRTSLRTHSGRYLTADSLGPQEIDSATRITLKYQDCCQVKVMLRVSTPASGGETGSSNGFFSLDKRKKQVTLLDPSTCGGSAAPEDRRVGVAAPKMFAFDAIFSQDDSQVLEYTLSRCFPS